MKSALRKLALTIVLIVTSVTATTMTTEPTSVGAISRGPACYQVWHRDRFPNAATFMCNGGYKTSMVAPKIMCGTSKYGNWKWFYGKYRLVIARQSRWFSMTCPYVKTYLGHSAYTFKIL